MLTSCRRSVNILDMNQKKQNTMIRKTKEDKEFEKILAIISLKSHGNDCLCSQCQVDKKKLDGDKK